LGGNGKKERKKKRIHKRWQPNDLEIRLKGGETKLGPSRRKVGERGRSSDRNTATRI